MLFRRKIPCYVLAFEQIGIIKQSLEFLIDFADKLDLIIIENPSANTSEIKKIVDEYGKKGLIKRYYSLDENITGNAFSLVINKEIKAIKKTPLVLLTDGDLICKNKDWLKEEISILKHHREIFACGISLDLTNLPVESFPDATTWIPKDKSEQTDFYETYTGIHLLLLRGRELVDFMNWKNSNKLPFVDGMMHQYCYEKLQKMWSRTKKAKAYHLTWDLYQDKKHPYTQLKIRKSFQRTWHHNQESSYKLTIY